MSFDTALAVTLRWEGGAVDHPSDPGGRTNKGITQATFDSWCKRNGEPPRDVFTIRDDEVQRIYREDYWDKAGCEALGEPLDLAVFDAAVNHGVNRALKFLLNARAGNPPDVVKRYCDAREAFYKAIILKNPKLKAFERGWANRLAAIRAACGLASERT